MTFSRSSITVLILGVLTLLCISWLAGNPYEAPVIQHHPGRPVSASPDMRTVDPYAYLAPVPVGQPAPDFLAPTASTGKLKLSSLRGKNVVLIFYQGSFCTVCGAQLQDYQKHLGDFAKRNTQVIAISADDVANAQQTQQQYGLSFPLVADPGKLIIRQYGIANLLKNGIAWPAVFVVDRQGRVRFHYANAQGARLYSADALKALQQIK